MSAPVKKCKVTPLEARCAICLDTGEVGQMGYLDCKACDVATKRAELESWAQDHCLAHVCSDDLWRIHQHALAAAPVVPVAAQPVVPEGWSVDHPVPWASMTNKAQNQLRYSAKRNAAPFCDQEGVRIWFGPSLESAMKAGCAALGLPYAAPSLEAQPAGEVVYQVQHALGPDWTDVTKPVYDKWWRENRRVIHLTAMAQGEKHEPT